LAPDTGKESTEAERFPKERKKSTSRRAKRRRRDTLEDN
jgi:hypothetical protein